MTKLGIVFFGNIIYYKHNDGKVILTGNIF